MFHFKTKILILTSLILFGLLIWTGVSWTAGDYGLRETAGAAELTIYESSVPVLVGNVIGAGLSMIGVIFFGLMVYGGVLWMTARGNDEQTKKAKNTIIAASIGMIIVLASYAITSFVFESVQSGGGGGLSGDEQCIAMGTGYSCVNISGCGLDLGTLEDVGTQRTICDVTGGCHLNKCQGSYEDTEIVCCNPAEVAVARSTD